MGSKSMSVTNVHMSRIPNVGLVIICLYVDDMLIMGSDNEVIKTTKKMFNNKFNMKDLGVADVILGIKISKTSYECVASSVSV